MRLGNIIRLFLLLFALYSTYFAQCQVLNYETDIIVDKDGQKTTTRTYLIQIRDQEHNDLSHIEIKHSPKQKFILNFARILDSENSVVRKLKKKDISTISDRSYYIFYQDDLITKFDLFWSKYPYKIEYSYSIVETEFMHIADWTPIISTKDTTLQSKLQVTLPIDYQPIFKMSPEISFEDTIIESNKVMTWSAKATTLPKKELFSPTIRDLLPFVKVILPTFYLGVEGSHDSWASFGKWMEDLNLNTDILPQSEQDEIKILIGETTDKKEIIKILYHYLQDHTIYVCVDIDIGGLKSYPASYVAQNKYGDCKALTTYMKSLLKSVGIESYYTLISAGDNFKKIDIDFPSQQFNHIILCIPLEQDTIWLENTSNAIPFGYLGSFTQNRLALAINGDQSQLIRTPTLLPEDVLCQKSYTFEIDEEQNWKNRTTLNFRGDNFTHLRALYAYQKTRALKRFIKNQINLERYTLEDYSVVEFNRDSTSIEFEVTGNCPDQFKKVGDFLVAKPLKVVLPDFEKPSERDLEVKMNFPINQLFCSYYPLNISADRELFLPDETELSNKYGFYKTTFLKTDNQIVAKEHFILYSGIYSLEEYSEFYAFLESIKTYKKKSLILIK